MGRSLVVSLLAILSLSACSKMQIDYSKINFDQNEIQSKHTDDTPQIPSSDQKPTLPSNPSTSPTDSSIVQESPNQVINTNTAITNPTQPTETQQITNNENNTESTKTTTSLENILKEKIKSLFVIDWKFNHSLTEEDLNYFHNLAEELSFCGISVVGPQCNDVEPTALVSTKLMDITKEEFTFFSEILFKNISRNLIFAFKVSQVNGELKISQLDVQTTMSNDEKSILTFTLTEDPSLSSSRQISLAPFLLLEDPSKLELKEATLKALSHPQQIVRLTAIKALANVGLTNKDLLYIVPLLNQVDADERIAGVKLLGRIGSPQSLKILLDHIEDMNDGVQEAIMNELLKVKLSEKWVPEIKKHFASEQKRVRKNIARLLGAINAENSLQALKAQLKIETTAEVREQIELALSKIKLSKKVSLQKTKGKTIATLIPTPTQVPLLKCHYTLGPSTPTNRCH